MNMKVSTSLFSQQFFNWDQEMAALLLIATRKPPSPHTAPREGLAAHSGCEREGERERSVSSGRSCFDRKLLQITPIKEQKQNRATLGGEEVRDSHIWCLVSIGLDL